MLVLAMSACSKDEDDVIEIKTDNIAAQWRVTATDSGTGWISCDTDDYDAALWLMLSEDGSCLLLLKECIISGNYSFANNTAVLSDMDGVVKGKCEFTDVRQHTATATVTTTDNKKVDIRMTRDNREPLTYRDPVAFLKGRWQQVKSKYAFDDSDYVNDNDGSVVFDGNHATFEIKGNKFSTTFSRLNFYSIYASDGKDGFIIRSVKNSDDIEVYTQQRNMIFKRQ